MIMQPLSRTMRIPILIDGRPSRPPVSAHAVNSLSSSILILENNLSYSIEVAHLCRSCTLVGKSPTPARQTIPQELHGSADCFLETTLLSFIAWAGA